MKLKILLLATAAATISIPPAANQATLSLGGYEDTADSGENAFDGFNLQNSPILFNYVHSGVQILYTADELQEMANSNITAIKFKYYNEGAYADYSGTAKIYIQESELSEFEKDETTNKYKWFVFDSENPATQVELTTSFGEDGGYMDGEYIFDLSAAPFSYEGKNIAITVVNDGIDDNYVDPGMGAIRFYRTDANNRSLIYGSDTEDYLTYIAKNPTATGNTELHESPAVQFVYEATESGVAENVATINSVAGTDNAIWLVLGADANVKVYTTTGQLVAAEKLAAGNHSIAANRGVYVVRINNNTYKAIVK